MFPHFQYYFFKLKYLYFEIVTENPSIFWDCLQMQPIPPVPTFLRKEVQRLIRNPDGWWPGIGLRVNRRGNEYNWPQVQRVEFQQANLSFTLAHYY